MVEYCYVGYSDRLAAYKIGGTINLHNRLAALQRRLGVKPVLALGLINPERTCKWAVCGWMERGLHELFSEKRLRSHLTGQKIEWFLLDAEDLDRIRNIKVPVVPPAKRVWTDEW